MFLQPVKKKMISVLHGKCMLRTYIHNKNKKTINYKNAWLKIYDKPVAYFPKFSHPDPTVNRQSGFLSPHLINSSTHGLALSLPYYYGNI